MMINLLMITVLAWGVAERMDPGEQAIRALLDQQQKEWNRSNVEAFMQGYDKSDSLVFTSGGAISRGWQSALERYLMRYPDRDAMGQLAFTEIEVTMLARSAAVVLGKWALARKSDHPHGVFTLVLQKKDGAWRIIHDHTSQSP